MIADTLIGERPGPVRELVLPSPILSLDLLHRIAKALDEARRQSLPLIVRSAHPMIFLAGADLGEIGRLDAGSSREYARRGRAVLHRLHELPAPVVAAVHGPCMGGGLDLALACDAIVASPNARFGHPGARRGLVTGWGGTVMLPWAAGSALARKAFLACESISAGEGHTAGWVALVTPDPVEGARAEALRLGSLHPRRLVLWRTLRSGRFIDRFRSCVVHHRRKQHPLGHRETS